MKYHYYDLGPLQYDGLIVSICRRSLGARVQDFFTDSNGGHDVRFDAVNRQPINAVSSSEEGA